MKIETTILEEFLTEARMGEVETCLLQFNETGLFVSAMAIANSHKADSMLKKEAFVEYEAIGNVGVDDLSKLIKVFKRLGKEIEFTVEGNLLTVKSGSKKVEIELISEAFLTTDDGEPKLEFAETFTLDNGKVKEIVGDVSLNKDAYLKIETAEKKVLFSNTGKYKFHSEVEAPACKGGVIVNFGKPLVDSIASLDSDLIFSVSTDYPTKVMEKTEDAIITLIVAPRMPDE